MIEHHKIIKAQGYGAPFQALSPFEAQKALEHFTNAEMGDGYIQRGNELTHTPFHKTAMKSYRLQDTLAAPGIAEAFTARAMVSVARDYLGFDPVIYSVNAFWTLPGHERVGIQKWHRDFDDRPGKFLTLFLFLTETGPENGAHHYLAQSHRAVVFDEILALQPTGAPPEKFYARGKHSEVERAINGPLAAYKTALHGTAGMAVFVDTYGLHAGGIPKTPRLIAWARYGNMHNDVAGEMGRATPEGLPAFTDEQRAILSPLLVE